MSSFDPSRDKFAPNTTTPNAVLFARRDAYDRAHRTGAYAEHALPAAEQVIADATNNLRRQFDDAIKALSGHQGRLTFRSDDPARGAYESCYAKALRLAEMIEARTGQALPVPGLIPKADDIAALVRRVEALESKKNWMEV
jgi:hypothetical protein